MTTLLGCRAPATFHAKPSERCVAHRSGHDAHRRPPLAGIPDRSGALGTFMVSAAVFAALLLPPAVAAAGWTAIHTNCSGAARWGWRWALTAVAIIYSPLGPAVRRPHEPGGDADVLSARQGRAADAVAYVAAQFTGGTRRHRGRRLALPAASSRTRRSTTSRPCPAAGRRGRVRGRDWRSRSCMMLTVLTRVEHAAAGAVHRPLRRPAGRGPTSRSRRRCRA